MNSPYLSPVPRKFFSLLAACALAVPVVMFAAGGQPSGGGAAKPKVSNPGTELLNAYDTNHNGKLETAELKIMQQLAADNFKTLMVFDKNSDKAIDSTELANWVNWKKNNGGGGGGGPGGGGPGGGGGGGGGGGAPGGGGAGGAGGGGGPGGGGGGGGARSGGGGGRG